MKKRLSIEIAVIPIPEEQIIGEREITRRYSDQSIFRKDLESFNKRHTEQKEKSAKQFKSGRENEKDCNNIKKDKGNKEKDTERFKERPPNHEIDPNGPQDRYNFTLIMFFILGIVHMLPFNFFFMANEYWMYKFRDVTSNSTDANDRTWLQANFRSVSHLISAGPSTLVQLVLTFVGHKIKARTRIFFTLIVQTILFLFQTAFVQINTDDWQVLFFGIAVLALTAMYCSMGFGSTGNLVAISMFPDQYLKSYLLGEGVAGLCTAIMRLVTVVMTPTVTSGALLYFITGSVIMTVSTSLLYVCTNTPFYKYYTRKMKNLTKKQIPRLPEFIDLLGYIWPLLILKAITMLIPLDSVYNLVVSEFYGTDSVWGNKYFVTCTTYLLPAVCDIVSRIVFYRFEINPTMSVLFLLILSQEAIFTPLMFFVNAKPREHLPVLFSHDWQYAVLMASQSFSRGYTGNIWSLKSLRSVPEEKMELSWLVILFVMKSTHVASSPLSLLCVSLL